MRIVFINSSRIWGGNEKWTCEAAAGLGGRGHEVRLVGHSPLMARKAASYGIDYHHLRLRGDGDIRGVALLWRLFAEWRPDAVILTKLKEYWLGGIAAKLAKVNKIYFRMGIDRPVQRNLKYRLLLGKICDMFIVNAESVRETLLKAPFIRPERITVVRNGIAIDGAPKVNPALMSSLGVPPGAAVVGGTGRLAKQKGFDVLIRAFRTVRSQCPEAFLVIAGEGHERKALSKLLRQLDLTDAVLMPGFVEDMPSFYKGLSLFALPSRFEGMPNVLLEAMASGVPVVATRVSGVVELVQDRRTGHLVKAEDPEALAARIIETLNSEDQRKALAERARRLVETQYGIDRMLDDLEKTLAAGCESADLAGRLRAGQDLNVRT
jgi:glycosyltransferase involved in cell wall biosynthesis